ncbi:putative transposase [Colletotrichum sublineola]|uniref:Putative transposase n=1 Tax=Colletotrichum sublineola TaxID=1173701 RepID=A0A066XKL8_COLSU|nr:putative transposase [Colletotrichum sublineola]
MVEYTENEVDQALADINNGVSTRVASRRWGVPRSTLRHRMAGVQQRSAAFEDFQRLSATQEAHLATWVTAQAALGLPPTHQQRLWPSHPPSYGGYQTSRKERSRSIDSRRVNGASTEIIRDWFKYLAIPRIQAIKPANRYNMDETGILEGKGDNGLVLGSAATRSVRKKQPGSRA